MHTEYDAPVRSTLWVSIILAPTLAHAEWEWPEANPGRPSFSDNSDATATGAFEVEAGIATVKGDDGIAQYAFKYGIDPRVDVRFNLEHVLWGGGKQLTGASALVKVVPKLSDDRVLGIAFEGYLSLPVADGEQVGGGGLAIATFKRDDLQVDACAIFDVGRADGADTTVTITPVVSIGYTIAGPFGAFVEPGIDLAVAGGGDHNPYVGAGVGYAVSPALVLDAAFYVGDEPSTLILAGLTFSMFVPPKLVPPPRP